jgi:Peptidase M15
MPYSRNPQRTRGWFGNVPATLFAVFVGALCLAAGAPVVQADGGSFHQPGEAPHQYSGKRGGRDAAPNYLGGSDTSAKQRRARAGSLAGVDDEAIGKQRAKSKRVASLKSNDDDGGSGGYSAKPKVSGGHVSWVASGSCLPGSLKSVIAEVSQYGRVVVSSTHRSDSRNRAAGGASNSYHLNCQAADFRVHGNVASAASFLRNHGSVGGFHHYGGGLFHIDTGPKRSW